MTTTTTTAPPIDGFHHITLPVHDLESAERFYVGVLGAQLVRKVDRETFLRVSPERATEADAANSPQHLSVRFGDGPELDLFVQRNRGKVTPVPHPHLAMRVDPDHLEAFVQRLRAANVPIDGPRRLGPPGHASVYFADPFGNTLELVTMGYEGAVLEGAPDVSKLGWGGLP
jgi:catechol 2,3-dioxygenase-like lactoylglutathione lyase family enzyme